MTRLLRLVAIAIAIAGSVDPAISVSGASRARVAVIALQPASPAARSVRDRLTSDLSPRYEIVPHLTSDASAAIVIGDRYPVDPLEAEPLVSPGLSDTLLVATVTTGEAVSPGVRIVRIGAPQEVPNATVIHLDVELEAAGVAGQTTEVTAVMAGLESGRASHRWTAETRWPASIDAVPVGEPPYVLRVATTAGLKPDTTDAVTPAVFGSSRTVADVVVDARRGAFRVEFYDARPSWATTFLRRALEADARFQVAALSFTSRGVSAQSGGAVAPGDPRLDAFDVVIAGGLDRLSAADGRALDRFMRERGGAVVIVPDQRIDAGPARDLVSGSVRLQPDRGLDLVERVLEQPATLSVAPPAAALQASELVVLRALTPGAGVIARVPGDRAPVIVSMPRGDGRLLLSGAMDAWRFRAADNGAFDRFWQSTVAGLALATPPPIAIDVEPPLLKPGERGEAIVRVRSRGVTAVSASLDDDQPIRLRPEPEQGVYRGTFTAKAAAGRSILEVRTESSGSSPVTPGPGGAGRQTQSASALRTVIVRQDVQRLAPPAGPSLSMLSSSHRGIDVTPEHVADVERFLRSAVTAPREPRLRHPMRSTWWIVPFALCLSAEWWMRRRRGLR